MKNIKKIIFLFLIVNTLVFSQALITKMQEGNDAYQNKNYQEAIKNYESILNQGYLSTDLFYNLGNSYFKAGKIGKSILYYEKSLKVSPTNEDAEYNLQIARARTVDRIQEIPPLFFFKWWESLLAAFTSEGWQIIVFIFYMLLLTSVAVYFLIRNMQIKKYSYIFGILNLGALVLSSVLLFASISRESSKDFAILMTSTANVKISPDQQSEDAFVIHEGIKFKIEEQVKNWVKIKLSDGKVGWLPKNTFEII
ncbi:MAG: hypothetical protein CR986_03865 [Ignavibacteriae bacterium]|nr:MAG: hypothetical protein CR986_03865 [Ignavibacteriota bacterium]